MSNKLTNLQLYRILRLNDKYDSYIFTFIIPSQLIKGFLQSVQSKEFYYGGHYWFIRIEYNIDTNDYNNNNNNNNNNIIKDDKHYIQYRKQPLSISIHLCNLSNGMLCKLKCIRFTIPNQQYYTQNIIYENYDIQFNCNHLLHKKSAWIEYNQLINEHYLFDDSTCLLEVELKEIITIYEEQLRIPRDTKEILRCKLLESTTFTFAGNDWSFIIDWHTLYEKSRIQHKDDNRPICFIQRHNTPKYWSNLKYTINVNWHDLGKSTSGLTEDLINPESGATTKPFPIGELKWFTHTSTPIITVKHRISVKIDFYSVTHISLIDLIPTSPQGGRNCAHLIDPNGIEWVIMSDILGTFVHLKLFLPQELNTHQTDNNLNLEVRSTAWSVQLIPYDQSLSIVKSMSPFYVIYTSVDNTTPKIMKQNSRSQCQEVVLPLDVEKVCSSNFGYSRPSDNAITLRIEWLYSHILCRGNYQNYDELIAMQRYNLLRDITIKDQEIERLSKQKIVQFTTTHRDNEHYGEKLSDSNVNYTKKSLNTRKSSEILSSPRSSYRDSSKIKQTPLQASISSNSSVYSGNSLTNLQSTKQLLTPSVIIDGNFDSNADNIDNNHLNLTNDLSSSPPYWRRHSSCLEDVGTTKPRQRRQLPSPPQSSSSSITGLILPGGNNHTISSNEHFHTIQSSNNNNNSPRLSLKQTTSDFVYFN
ncbi:hypothetical protein MN116_000677 [Schistosoma mekongi]|uniref:MATH domain-containing protein n=1 Tax=Schistosoma mekongi TaxID=38744 RepID=A0AAE1ZLB3_SCHME|nr:hypothetical protein MN116_000677 [Schistosoma mekongi]